MMPGGPAVARCAAILPAGGSGSRFGSELPKQFVAVQGDPLITWAIRRFVLSGIVERIVIAVPPAHRDLMASIVERGGWSTPIRIVDGGETRQESVANALAAAEDVAIVAVHDAVRPLFSPSLLQALLAAAAEWGGAIPGLPLTETIHRVADGWIDESPRREEFIAAQTPQCFRTDILVDALRRARAEGHVGTDEAGVVARYGHRVRVLAGESGNVKVTHPADLERLAGALEDEELS
jgi:2-C-methyl-D-erythritol 4-phosphate cytidylyltransferase